MLRAPVRRRDWLTLKLVAVATPGIHDERLDWAVRVDGRREAAPGPTRPRERRLLQHGVPLLAPDALREAPVRPHVHQHGERHAPKVCVRWTWHDMTWHRTTERTFFLPSAFSLARVRVWVGLGCLCWVFFPWKYR